MASRPDPGRRPPESPHSRARTANDGQRRSALVELLTPAVASTGLELEGVELRTVGRRLVLRVLVDSDHGVSLDEVATASTAVSDALDVSDVLGDEPYTLEVSSPGVDRPLTTPRHWQRAVGRLVAVSHAGAETTGRLTAVTDEAITLDVDVKGRTRAVTIPLASVTRAVVQVEFSRAASADVADTDDGDDSDITDTDDEASDHDASDDADPTDPDEIED
jgi:ribosome maturation factor RimP